MAGFIAGGSSYGGNVVMRRGLEGVVWVWRAGGKSPALSALCLPFSSFSGAVAHSKSIANSIGWRCSVRRARRCEAEWECKVLLPAGVSAAMARRCLS